MQRATHKIMVFVQSEDKIIENMSKDHRRPNPIPVNGYHDITASGDLIFPAMTKLEAKSKARKAKAVPWFFGTIAEALNKVEQHRKEMSEYEQRIAAMATPTAKQRRQSLTSPKG